MANTFTLISTTTVGAGGAASIEFTSIPQTGTDLVLLCSLRSTRNSGGVTSIFIKVNDLTTSIYSTKQLDGDGASASSGGASSVAPTASSVDQGLTSQATNTANTFGNASFYFANYAGSTNKTISADSVSENNATTAYQRIAASMVATSSGITKITLLPVATFNWAEYSTASLYTVTKGSGGATVS